MRAGMEEDRVKANSLKDRGKDKGKGRQRLEEHTAAGSNRYVLCEIGTTAETFEVEEVRHEVS